MCQCYFSLVNYKVHANKPLFYIDMTVLLEILIQNYIRDSSGVFSISFLVKLSMISLISSLSLKLFLNSLVYDRNISGSSTKKICNLRLSSEIFEKCFATFV